MISETVRGSSEAVLPGITVVILNEEPGIPLLSSPIHTDTILRHPESGQAQGDRHTRRIRGGSSGRNCVGGSVTRRWVVLDASKKLKRLPNAAPLKAIF